MGIKLNQARCQGCGRTILTASCSVLGLGRLKAIFGVRCNQCVTNEERQALNRTIGEALAENSNGRGI